MLRPGMRIGVGWGRTLICALNAIDESLTLATLPKTAVQVALERRAAAAARRGRSPPP